MHPFQRSVELVLWCALTVIVGMPSHPAAAALDPGQVLLLYSKNNSESSTIASEYLKRRSGVRSLDLNLTYTTVADMENPQPNDLTSKYVHPEAFIDQIRDPVWDYLDRNPGILAIVTTRGLPTAIAIDFVPFQGQHQIVSSVEAQLARIGNVTTAAQIVGEPNPYHGHIGVQFEDFLADECHDGGAAMAGKMYLVTRLDSAKGSLTDFDRPSAVENVVSLINRSHGVDKSSVALVIDWCNLVLQEELTMLGNMAGAGWFVYMDPSPAASSQDPFKFLHGIHQPSGYPCQPALCSFCGAWEQEVEGRYAPFAELVHVGPGYHHFTFGSCSFDSSENFCTDVARYYAAHSAGLYSTVESFNGWSIHDANDLQLGQCASPVAQCHSHTNVLDWIAAGGSFTVGNIDEPGEGTSLDAGYAMVNLYLHGLSWAEAAYSGLYSLGVMQTPIGDPLAIVEVYNADLDGDTAVKGTDLAALLAAWGNCPAPCPADLKSDGQVNGQDLALLMGSWHLETHESHEEPIAETLQPMTHLCVLKAPSNYLCRGDLDGDWRVDGDDQSIMEEGKKFVGCVCPDLDVDGDGQFTSRDIGIVDDNQGDSFVDWANVDEIPSVTCADVELFKLNATCPPGHPYTSADAEYDLDCDGDVDVIDLKVAYAARTCAFFAGQLTCAHVASLGGCICTSTCSPFWDMTCDSEISGCDYVACTDCLSHLQTPQVCGACTPPSCCVSGSSSNCPPLCPGE